MRFRGGGVGHSSTRAATDTFKNDRDGLDMISQQARKEPRTHPNMEENNGTDDDGMDELEEISDGEREIEGQDDEDQLSESELVDYGYELEGESEEEDDDDDREPGELEEDNMIVNELGTLGYAEY